MKYILVTGASGFLGSKLCEVLLSLGHSVVSIGRKNAYDTTLEPSKRGFYQPQPFNIQTLNMGKLN